MAGLKQKHLALRHLGFSKKVVVIDEVHAYDAYMDQYLLTAIRWMGIYGVPVIILSATLPYKKREEMIKAYLMARGVPYKEIKSSLDDLAQKAYPLITYTDGIKACQHREFDKKDDKKIKIIKLKDEHLFETVETLIKDGGVIGIIANTVKRSQELARLFTESYGKETVDLLHSAFISTHRVEKEKRLLNEIGKKAVRPDRKIIIGTQVMEQSLDIDFDVLISDLAPMDLLIQRIGRLHRHKISRPKAHKQPVLYVLGTDENYHFNEGSVAIYGKYLLIRTQHYLKELITIPSDISPLVQWVYGEDEISIREDLIDTYKKAEKDHFDYIKSKKIKAQTYLIDNPSSRRKPKTLIGWLKNPHYNESEERAYAQVRDSKETVEVIALKKKGTGYAIFKGESDLSQLIGEADVGKMIAKETLRLPSVLTGFYNIEDTIAKLEAYNKKELGNWQKQPWLRGCLGIIFDETNNFILNDYKLTYDEKMGLMYERGNKWEDLI